MTIAQSVHITVFNISRLRFADYEVKNFTAIHFLQSSAEAVPLLENSSLWNSDVIQLLYCLSFLLWRNWWQKR